MNIVIFGLTISSSWGNGHATLWRGLCKALNRLGHEIVFFERNVPYYEGSRDWQATAMTQLILYDNWPAVRERAVRHLLDADVAIVTSYCTDAIAACQTIQDASHALSVFYDLDTPVTLHKLRTGERVPYLGPEGLRPYEGVLSFTGGAALDELETQLGARRTFALYGHVDPDVHRPAALIEHYRADLSYLGTYATDRQAALEALFVAPARACPGRRFVMGGAQYPDSFPWTENVFFVRHLPPSEHAKFFSSSRLTLNVTRAAMAHMGWCPSGRLFEAAACRTPILSDEWAGIADFYTPGEELVLARTTDDAVAALELSDAELAAIARRAYERTLDEHTSLHRARAMLDIFQECASGRPAQDRRTASIASHAERS